MNRRISLIAIVGPLLLIGAGCFQPRTPAPPVNAPSVNAPTPDGSGSGAPSPSGQAGTKKYLSAPYDFSYPAAYTITDRPMNEADRKPYLDAGLDAPLQFTMFATETRPEGFMGEGPPTVYVIQWNNAQRTPLREWARKQASYTGFTAEVDASGQVGTAAFQGRPSLAFEYDGLYGGESRLIDLGGTVLEVKADFDGEGGTNMAAFDMILSTIVFAK